MTRRAKIWMGVGAFWVLFNLAFSLVVVAGGELLHAVSHVAVGLLGGWGALWLAMRGARNEEGLEELNRPAEPDQLSGRLMNLEQSIDAVAIEVGRVGEAQRAMTRKLTETA